MTHIYVGGTISFVLASKIFVVDGCRFVARILYVWSIYDKLREYMHRHAEKATSAYLKKTTRRRLGLSRDNIFTAYILALYSTDLRVYIYIYILSQIESSVQCASTI